MGATSIRIAGTGSFVPQHVVTNDTIARLIERYVRGKDAAWAREKLGVMERRFARPLEPRTGYPIGQIDELTLAHRAASAAIERAGIQAAALEGLWYVSCTQSENEQHFSRLALGLHAHLGLRAEAFAIELDAGCGGIVHAIATAAAQMQGAGLEHVLIVASNMASQFFRTWEAYAQSDAWLSMYIFGDGAGAAVLRQMPGKTAGILAAYTAADPTTPLMEFVQAADDPVPLYRIDGRTVARSFRTYARSALSELQRRYPFRLEDVRRFYFHQVNAIVLRSFIAELAIPEERVAIHIDRYGNLASAATLVLLDEDMRVGAIGADDLCVFCVVGAGTQYGAMLVQL
jgi:3-oxoacyl-[acyl-carrier-protein] synthase III